MPVDARIVERLSGREGLLGQVAADREPSILSDIPDGYLTIGSALGRDKPRHLSISPAIADDALRKRHSRAWLERQFRRTYPQSSAGCAHH